MTIQIENEHQAWHAREAAQILREFAVFRPAQGNLRRRAAEACESLALRLDGAARAEVLAIRDRLATLTAEELRATAAAWELAAGTWETIPW